MKELIEVAEISVSYSPVKYHQPTIRSSTDAFDQLFKFYPTNIIGLQEHFVIMYLNQGNKILGVYRLSRGGITGTVADIRLILGVALKTAACSLIISHNHPSGNLKPSQSDIEVTNKIKEACKIMDLKLLDHLIINSEGSFFSFGEEGLLW